MTDADVEVDANVVDANVVDASDAMVPRPITNPDALHVACDVIEEGALPSGIDLVDTPINSNFGALTASDTAVAWVDLDGLHYQIGGGAIETDIGSFGGPRLDGDELFFSSSRRIISKRSLDTGEEIELAIDPTSSIEAIAPIGDAVYWASSDSADPLLIHLWRSDREPGETLEIGAYRGDPPYAYAVLGDYVYFARTANGSPTSRIARARRDASETVENLTGLIPNIGNIVSDGTTLFATISAHDSEEAPSLDPKLVVRIEADGALTTLYETYKVWWYPNYTSMLLDDTYLYWIARSNELTTEQSLWRGRKDGQGEPVQIVEGFLDGEILIAGNSSSIYLGLSCDAVAPVLRVEKPD